MCVRVCMCVPCFLSPVFKIKVSQKGMENNELAQVKGWAGNVM